jgi:hypothetical protein
MDGLEVRAADGGVDVLDAATLAAAACAQHVGRAEIALEMADAPSDLRQALGALAG